MISPSGGGPHPPVCSFLKDIPHPPPDCTFEFKGHPPD